MAQSSPSKNALEVPFDTNNESRTSLLSNAEQGKLVDKMANLNQIIDQMKEEVRIKDRLISKLLDNDEDEPPQSRSAKKAQVNEELKTTN